MGIDVYLGWKGQTEAEKKAQFTGFSTEHGHVGYLREAYHGGPYATAVLISEDWDRQPEGGFAIEASKLRDRLPATVMATLYRHHIVYGERLDDPGVIDLEKLGKSDVLLDLVKGALLEAKNAQASAGEFAPNEEQERAVKQMIAARSLPPYALAFVDFVDLAERKEKETGEPVRIHVSA